jgi:uncharacterized SAM-binding protein YcdF (DUF218 family)
VNPNPRQWFTRLGRFFCLLGFLAAVPLVLARTLLCVDAGFAQAEVIIVPGGGIFDRAPRAAELFHQGAAPRILLSGAGDCEENRRQLLDAGVPAAAIVTECRSTTTWENAQFTAPLLKSAGVSNAIIVTSWYHSRRALNTFRAVVPGIHFASMPAYHNNRFIPFLTLAKIYQEYPKTAWYWLRRGISPMVSGK